MAGRMGFRVAAASVGAAAVIAADFAPVPYLGPAVGVVLAILKLCEKVRVNKHEIVELGGRCESLLYALKDVSEQIAPEKMLAIVDSSVDLLQSIKEKMTAWIESSKVKQFFLQDDIAEDVKRCHQAIENFLTTFQISSHMQIHHWMATFAESQRQDQEETVKYLSDIQYQTHLIRETVVARDAQDASVATQIMAMMQNFMGQYQQGDYRHAGLSSNLYMIQQTSGQLLPDYDLKHGEVRRLGSHPVGGSAAFDIWEGEYLGKEKCAIKQVRGVEVTPKIRDRFLREVVIWRKLWKIDRGQYILPFWGAILNDGPYPFMVSPWMHYGDSLRFVIHHPDVNRKKIIRRVALALQLLHSQVPPIAHGDIKAANILINKMGEPLLADFGLSKMMEDITGVPFTQSRGVSESYRWFAPELCSAPGILSPASDVFAFSMTVLEVRSHTLLPIFHFVSNENV
ncbi:kinase-like protein [Phellopilus nigrolimitatus]|nr:kinase-like protein [Phellopilus nigrolimitatus]